MNITVNNKGKNEKYNLINSWDDVTLETWSRLVEGEKKQKTRTKQAVDSISALSDMPKRLIKELTLKDVSLILEKITEVQKKGSTKLKDKITIDGEQYGFHPNLEEVTLGEYADLENHIQNGVEKDLHKIMAALYRPIVDTEGKLYSIETYDTKTKALRAEKFKKMKASDVQNALVFFWTLGKELLKILPLYLTAKLRKETKED